MAPAHYAGEQAVAYGRIGLLAAAEDAAAAETAGALSESFGARVTRDEPHVDLLVVGSRPEAPEGRVMISACAQNAIENATAPVLVVRWGVGVRFPPNLACA